MRWMERAAQALGELPRLAPEARRGLSALALVLAAACAARAPRPVAAPRAPEDADRRASTREDRPRRAGDAPTGAEPSGPAGLEVLAPVEQDPAPFAGLAVLTTVPLPGVRGAPGAELPTIDTRARPELRVGLDADTAGMASALEHLRLGVRPPPETLRLEDLINAAAPRRPAAARLALEAELIRTPEAPRRPLLRLVARAPDGPPPDRVVVITEPSLDPDPSERARLADRARALIGALAARLGPDVGLDWIEATARPRHRLVGADAAGLIRALAETPAPSPAEGAALEPALAAAFDLGPVPAPAVVFVGLGLAPPLVAIADASPRGPVHVVGLPAAVRDDARLAGLAAGGGSHHQLGGPDTVDALVERLSGLVAPVLVEAELGLELDPRVVARYRLIGHASGAEDPRAEPGRRRRGALGARARAEWLIELELRGEGRLGAARLQGLAAADRRPVHLEIALPGQAVSLAEASPEARLAILAARLGESLAGRPGAPAPARLAAEARRALATEPAAGLRPSPELARALELAAELR